jgi:putative transport protein
MSEFVLTLLQAQPVLVAFLILGAGVLLGRLRIAGVQVGNVSGVLFVGLIAGHVGLDVPHAVQSIGFIFFIYVVGYEAGPQFWNVFRRDGVKYVTLGAIAAVTSSVLAVLMTRLWEFRPGEAVGMLAGAMTSTPVLVSARDAVEQGLYTPAGVTAEAVQANITSAYAITYVFGLVGLILMLTILPRMLRIDVAKEAQALAEDDAFRGRPSETQALLRVRESPGVRAYAVERDPSGLDASTTREWQIPGRITQIKRGGEVFTPSEDMPLERGDIVAVVGLAAAHEWASEHLGPEVIDHDVVDRTMISRHIMVTNRRYDGFTLRDLPLVEKYQCWLTRITRTGVQLPRRPDLQIQRGDVLLVTGPSSQIDRLAERMGYAEQQLQQTGLVAFTFSIAIGIALGLFSFTVAGTTIGLGTAGGVLLAGLLAGFLHSRWPTLGRLPGGARYIIRELGLLFFMVEVAVSAGHGFVETLQRSGTQLVVASFVVMVVPVALTFVVGRVFMRLNAAILLGAITGAMTSTAALQQVTAQAKSSIPMLGYVGTYTFANVMLALAGGVVVRF